MLLDSTHPDTDGASVVPTPWQASLGELSLVREDLGRFLELQLTEIERLATLLETNQGELRLGQERLAESETRLIDRARDCELETSCLLEKRADLAREQEDLQRACLEFAAERDSWHRQRAEVEEVQRLRANELDQRAQVLARETETLRADSAWLSSESESLASRESELVRRSAELEADRESLLTEAHRREAELDARHHELSAALAASEAQATELAAGEAERKAEAAAACRQSEELAGTLLALDEARTRLAEAEMSLNRALTEQADLRNEYTCAVMSLAETRSQLEASRGECVRAQAELTQSQLKFEEAHTLLRETHELLARTEQEWEADGKDNLTFLESRVAELEAERSTLLSQLAESRQQIEASLASSNAASALSAKLVDAEAQVFSLTEQVAVLAEQVGSSRGAADQLELLQTEHAALGEELAVTRAQMSRLAGAAIELADARAELMRRGEQITALQREQTSGTGEADKELIEQLRESERERTELESELEAVRGRIAELMETFNCEKNRMSEERSQWAVELRQLRRALELQSELLGEREAALQTVGQRIALPAEAAEPVVAATNPSIDPVLEAVREQFQRLQSNRIQRRMSGIKPGRQGVA